MDEDTRDETGALQVGTASACLAALLWYVIVFGAWLAPLCLRLAGERALAQALSRRAVIDSVSFNPFTWQFEVRGLSIYDPDANSVFFSLDGFAADFEPSQALSGRIAVKDVRIDGPKLRLVRSEQGTLNIADLIGAPGSAPDANPSGGIDVTPPDWLSLQLTDIRLSGGRIEFADEAKKTEHAVGDIHFNLPFFSTEELSRRAILESSGVVDASPLSLRLVADYGGSIPKIEFTAVVRDVHLKRFTDLVPALAGIDAGAKRAQLDVSASFGGGAMPDFHADLDLGGIRFAGPDGREVFAADGFDVQNVRYDFDSGGVRIGRVALRGFVADLVLTADGGLKSPLPKSTAKTVEQAPPAPASETRAGQPAPAAAPLPDVTLARVTFDDGKLSLRREGEEKPLIAVSQLDVSGWGMRVRDAAIDEIDVFVKSDVCSKFWIAVGGRARPLDGYLHLALDGLDLGSVRSLAPGREDLPALAGKAALSGTLRFKQDKQEAGATLEKGRFALRDFSLAAKGSAKPALTLENLAVDGIEGRFPARELSIAKLSVSGGSAAVELTPAGGAGLAGFTSPGAKSAAQPERAATSPPEKNAAVPQIKARLAELYVERFGVNAAGGGLAKPVEAQIESVRVAGAAWPPVSPVTVQAAAGLGALGRVEADVTVAQGLDAAKGKLALSSLSLPLLASFVPGLPVKVADGTLKIDGNFEFAKAASGEPDARFAGDVKLAKLSLIPQGGGEAVGISALSVAKLKAQTLPLSVTAEAVELDGARAGIEMRKDGSIALAGVAVTQPKQEQAPTDAAAKPDQAKPEKSAPQLPVSLGRLAVNAARIDFTDRSFEPPFKAGASVNLSLRDLAPNKPLALDLGVTVNGTGRIKVGGVVAPPPQAAAFDLKAAIENLDLAEGSAYARRFTGFPITTGKFGLAGDYKLSGGKLDLQNKIKVSHIQVGQKAPDAAAAIPIDLAVGLLSDASGNIDLDIPVTGDLSAVKVDLGQAIGKAVGAVFGRVLLGPFAFFASGSKTGQTMPLPFAAGSAAVEGEAATRLSDLAKALSGKTKATIEITGYADQNLEADGIKRFALRTKVADALGKSGQVLSDADYARLLPHYYARIAGGKNPGQPAQMESELLSSFSLSAADVATLAKGRAMAARDYLIREGISEAAIFLIAPDNPAPRKIEGVPFSRAELAIKR